jgi:hypothetical protein
VAWHRYDRVARQIDGLETLGDGRASAGEHKPRIQSAGLGIQRHVGRPIRPPADLDAATNLHDQ